MYAYGASCLQIAASLYLFLRTSAFLQNCPYCSDSSVKHFPPCSQITAATTHRLIAHNSKEDTFHTAQQLLGYHLECDNDRHHYTRELVTPTEPSNRAFPRLREFYPVGNSRNLREPYRSLVASHFNDSSSTLPIDQKVFTKNPTQHCTFHSQSSHQFTNSPSCQLNILKLTNINLNKSLTQQ